MATLVLNEREIGERWGIAFMGKRPPEENERTRLARRCATVAEARRLTPREREVMELLAQGKSLSGVAHELIIAEGTAKAHTRHIYEKLGINTRQELLDLLMTGAVARSPARSPDNKTNCSAYSKNLVSAGLKRSVRKKKHSGKEMSSSSRGIARR